MAWRKPDLRTYWRAPTQFCYTAPLNEKTKGMINADTLALMRSTTWLINTAHGGLVEPRALWEALEKGQLAGGSTSSRRRIHIWTNGMHVLSGIATSQRQVTARSCRWNRRRLRGIALQKRSGKC